MKYYICPERKPSGRINGLVLMAIAMFTLPSLIFAQSPEVRTALRQIDNEQPKKAIAALEQIASQGDNSNNQYYLGLGYLRTGAKDKALAAFEKGISLEEKDGLNYAGKAQVKFLDKNATEAKTLIEKALQVSKSKKADVWRAVGEAYMADSKFLVDAINALNKARSLNNTDPETHVLLGEAYLAQNNGGESVTSFERAATADPKWGKPNYKIAKVFQRSKNNSLVMENLTKAVTVDPQFAPAWKELGEQYYVQKQPEKAVDAIEKYMAISEKAEESKMQYAFFLIMAKRFDQANAIFNEVLSKPNPPAVALKYAGYALMEKDTTRASAEQAKPLFEKYFQVAKPEDIQASDYAYYGKMLLEIGDDSLANENFARSLTMDSAQLDVAQLHASTYLKRRKYDEAIDAYKHLMSLRKEPLATDNWSIGQAYYFSGKYNEADTAFTQVVEKLNGKAPLPVYLYAARARANVDSTMESGIAKPMYEQYLEKALADPERNKTGIIETYEYLGAYYIHKEENVNTAKTYYEKILAIDPKHEEALKFIRTINTPAQKSGGGAKGGR